MGKYLVTQAQWEAVMGNNPSRFKGGSRPVEYVSWNDATEFCQKLSEITGKKYSLPSESQWQYACRSRTTTPFYFGETITSELVNYNGNYPYADAPKGIYRKQTTDVGIFPPNSLGLYDMHGNVWEWCQDVWHDNYNGAPTDGSAWETRGNSDRRLLRGGCWYIKSWVCRCAVTTTMRTTPTTIGVFGLSRWFLSLVPRILPLYSFPIFPFSLFFFSLFPARHRFGHGYTDDYDLTPQPPGGIRISPLSS